MSRIITSGDDWMRDVEKRVGRQERRPAPASFADQLGPGITQRTRSIVDWNDPATLRNGWYFSDVLSLNTPDPMVPWTGTVTITSDNRGMQRLTSHEARPRTFVRTFEFGASAIPTFGVYRVEHEDTGEITAILGNGFTHYDTTSHGPVWYSRVNGWVSVGGLGTIAVATSANAFVLPQGFRPWRIQICSAWTQGGSRRLDVRQDGAVVFSEGSGTGYASFVVPPFRAQP